MAIEPDPTVQRGRLRVELRKARDAAGQKQGEVASAMEWSLSKLIRIENGAVGISTNDLKALMTHYGIKDKRRTETLLELARASRERSWYDRYDEVLTPGFREYLAYEASATVIRQYEPVLIPGLLQTEEYAMAILGEAHKMRTAEAERLWAVREHRQELHERRNPPDMQFIIDEAAIRRWAGGVGVMRRQLERVREIAAMDHVTFQIVPFSAGMHPGVAAGPFWLLEFAEADLNDLVYLEGAGNTTMRDRPDEVARLLDIFEELEKQGVASDDVDAMLARASDEMVVAAGGEAPAPQGITD